MSDAALVERSRAAFAAYYPRIIEAIERNGGLTAAPVVEQDEIVDLRIDGHLIYGRDARRFTTEQVEAYLQKPLRIFMHRLDLTGIVTKVGQRLVAAFEDDLRAQGTVEVSTHPSGSPTFLISFGLGLGYHLAELTRRTEARWLLLVEPLPEFFVPSFGVVDWAELLETYKARGGEVCIISESDPNRIVAAIVGLMAGKGIPYADGSWVFTHYPFWSFAEARDRLHEALEFTFTNRGFFEDELVMMRNAVTNFSGRAFRLLDGRRRLRRPETAVVVGAGPSLDAGIEALRRNRDRMVVFSAGTALRALLRAGIVPDFQCELENVPGVYDVLVETAKVADISGITLISSATVDPRVPALFGDAIFYFRDSISSTQILGGKHRIIEGTSPTCVNLAINAGAVMGFTEFVLFGTDCGVRPGSLRHAKGTVYSEVGVYEAGNRTQGPTTSVEGNFGGLVNSEPLYDSCRVMLSSAIRNNRLNVLNCSDGALIPGAKPRVPDSLTVATPVVDAVALRAEIRHMLPRYLPGQILEEANFGAIHAKVVEMFAALDALLVELGEGKPDFGLVYDRVMSFVAQAKDRFAHTEALVSGSLSALPRIAMFYGYRVVDAAQRKRSFDLFIAEFRAIAADMARQLATLFDDLSKLTQSPARLLAANEG